MYKIVWDKDFKGYTWSGPAEYFDREELKKLFKNFELMITESGKFRFIFDTGYAFNIKARRGTVLLYLAKHGFYVTGLETCAWDRGWLAVTAISKLEIFV